LQVLASVVPVSHILRRLFFFVLQKEESVESLIFRVYYSFAFTCLWSIIVSVFVFLGWFLFFFPPFWGGFVPLFFLPILLLKKS
jgi:hypothetical protein